MPPAAAGEIIVKGIERRSPRVLVGNDAKFLQFLERLTPISYLQALDSQAVMAPYDTHSQEWHFIPSKELCRDKTSTINRQMGLPNSVRRAVSGFQVLSTTWKNTDGTPV